MSLLQALHNNLVQYIILIHLLIQHTVHTIIITDRVLRLHDTYIDDLRQGLDDLQTLINQLLLPIRLCTSLLRASFQQQKLFTQLVLFL